MIRKLLTISRFVLFCTFIVVTSYHNVFADDASFGGDGATIFALKESRIRMARENIVISKDQEKHWRADCEFEFENTSNEKVDLQMGFPDWILWDAPEGDDKDHWAIKEFKASIDGKELITTHKEVEKGLPNQEDLYYQGAFTWPVSFAPHARIIVKNSYLFEGLSSNGPLEACLSKSDQPLTKDFFWKNAPSLPGSWDYDDSLCSAISYIVTTANTWNGPIGKADIKMQIHHHSPILPHQIVILPTAKEVKDGWITWHFENWTPRSEIKVIYLMPTAENHEFAATAYLETVQQAQAWMKYAKKNGFDKKIIESEIEALPDDKKAIKAALEKY